MIPQAIDRTALENVDLICAFAERWRIDWTLAARLHVLAGLLPFGISIISGWRSREEQEGLERQGRPAAAFELSTHTSCPVATGADLRLQVGYVARVHKITLGEAAGRAGLRWGGGSTIEDGIPLDWNHVDLGPRNG